MGELNDQAAPAAKGTRFYSAHDTAVAPQEASRLRGGFVRASGENRPHETVVKVGRKNPLHEACAHDVLLGLIGLH